MFDNTLFFSEEGVNNTRNWYLQDVTGTNKKSFTSKGTISPIGYQSKQFFFEEAVVNKSKKMVRTLTKYIEMVLRRNQ
ncbi:hypothetical protein [Paenibacillus macquariensis]|uniref:Uncharacterized protein n=1 Tax=Paenibacillus macquariensis TaxID=948756 RepID=A0ABY1KH94_9BACL|nr:hypothetical protein [Paenibacillus macquariensis]MEC0094380.1 hypothetical protein [Paenibacillus macquariensis]OAB26021.1 hypothetical protein PMSM_27495 [Paenibacillus macquariensis subsp. macquariensis]SIR74983.1 hypothetical protein SAMN05421578_1652 [Paenibacillus macquariensis]